MSTEQVDIIEVSNVDNENIVINNKKSKDLTFDTILNTLTLFKSQITSLQNQIKQLEKSINKEKMSLEKKANKNKPKTLRKPSGFAKSTKISNELCEFMNKPIGSEVARTEVTKYIVDYIKTNGLQKQDNKKYINPDQSLKSLLSVTDDEEVTYFNIQKYMNRHFIKSTASTIVQEEQV
jgi:chromatin remodeling complex protein RSC6